MQDVLTAVVVSAKFFEDRCLTNEWSARVGGLSTQELNSLEVELLERLRWRVAVSQEE